MYKTHMKKILKLCWGTYKTVWIWKDYSRQRRFDSRKMWRQNWFTHFKKNFTSLELEKSYFSGTGKNSFKTKTNKGGLALLSEKAMAPTPVLLPGKSHGQRSLVGCSPRGHEESDTTEPLPFHFSLLCIGEGNGNPLQCSCLENPRDGGAWWAACLWGRTELDTTEAT